MEKVRQGRGESKECCTMSRCHCKQYGFILAAVNSLRTMWNRFVLLMFHRRMRMEDEDEDEEDEQSVPLRTRLPSCCLRVAPWELITHVLFLSTVFHGEKVQDPVFPTCSWIQVGCRAMMRRWCLLQAVCLLPGCDNVLCHLLMTSTLLCINVTLQ